MSIDWVTVLAQLANFLLLVWLLRRFLYLPILNGIDAREAAISRRMADAETARKEAQAAKARYQHQLESSAAQQEARVAEALEAAEHEREQILAEARQQLKREQADWRRHMERDREDFIQRMHQAGSQTLLDLTRKVLHDLADEPLEAAIGRRAGLRLRPLASELGRAIGSGREALVSTHAALAPDVRERIRADLQEVLPGVDLQFTTDPSQSPGLTIQIGGVQVAWTIDSYLDELDRVATQYQVAALRHEEGHDGR